MIFQDLESIKNSLDEEFLLLEPLMDGFRLLESTITESILQDYEKSMHIVFPEDFRSVVKMYCFDRFSMGPIHFCNNGNYLEWIRDLNTPDIQNYRCWWSTINNMKFKPFDKFMIANSDLYIIILDTISGTVSALPHISSSESSFLLISSNFSSFLRGVGSIVISRLHDQSTFSIIDDVCSSVGASIGNIFWKWLGE